MGIRYYAYSVRSTDIELARADPRAFLCRVPLDDDWDELTPRMPYLDLDKCWHQLQELLGPKPERPARDAFQLVEGQVTHTSMGWIPFIQVLDPAQVREVAEDLAQVGEAEVLTARIRGFHVDTINDDPEELGYVMHYLRLAAEFTAALVPDDLGLIYTIG